MENFAQNYIKFDIFGTFLFKKGVNPKSLVAALLPLSLLPLLVLLHIGAGPEREAAGVGGRGVDPLHRPGRLAGGHAPTLLEAD